MEKLERKNYLSPPEAAEMMMCSKIHVHNLIRARVLPVYQVGTRFYIPRKAVEAHIEAHTFPAITQEENQEKQS